MNRQTGREIDRQTDRQTGRKADRQTDRQTSRDNKGVVGPSSLLH